MRLGEYRAARYSPSNHMCSATVQSLTTVCHSTIVLLWYHTWSKVWPLYGLGLCIVQVELMLKHMCACCVSVWLRSTGVTSDVVTSFGPDLTAEVSPISKYSDPLVGSHSITLWPVTHEASSPSSSSSPSSPSASYSAAMLPGASKLLPAAQEAAAPNTVDHQQLRTGSAQSQSSNRASS